MMNSLEATDQASAAVAKAPRVSLADIEAAIEHKLEFIAGDMLDADGVTSGDARIALNVLSICLIIMRNGFTVIGKSAPADPNNFNAELGKKFAYEDAVRQLWPLMGYALRESLSERASLAQHTQRDNALGSMTE
jgi:hypothetical protein